MNNKGIMGIIERMCNQVDPRIIHHGYRVSVIVSKMLPELGIRDEKMQRDICFLALLHDIGAYKTEEIDKLVQFETYDVLPHSVYSYLFIRNFSPLRELAEAVLLHHTLWSVLKHKTQYNDTIKMIAQAIFMADRADIMAGSGRRSWTQFLAYAERSRDVFFQPEMVETMKNLQIDLPIDIGQMNDADYMDMICRVPFTQEEITEYLKMLTYVIDFRSRHTVTHTITTTSICQEISELMNLDEISVKQVVSGALLHDLGKIGIPSEILEFPGKLTPQAMTVMKEHVNITEQIFGDAIEERVKKIALRHHEKLNGTGYPKGLDESQLSTEERIVAVADIVSALAGTRSYKKSFDKDKIITVIKNMSYDELIDSTIVDVMVDNYDRIMEATAARCEPVLNVYNKMQIEFENMNL